MREGKGRKGIGLFCKLLAGVLAAGCLSAPVNACETVGLADSEAEICSNCVKKNIVNDSDTWKIEDADRAADGALSAFSDFYAKPENTPLLIAGKRQDWKLENPVRDKKEYTLALTPEQAEGAAGLYYSILIRKKTGEFVPVMDQIQIVPDKKGVLHLDLDPHVMALKAQGELVPWPVTQVEVSKKYQIYQTQQARLMSGGFCSPKRPAEDAAESVLTLQTNASGGRVTVKSVAKASQAGAEGSGVAMASQDDVLAEEMDAAKYDLIAYEEERLLPVWDASGNLLPISSWRTGSAGETVLQNIEDPVNFVFAETSEFLDDFYYVVTLVDQGGQEYLTEPVKIVPRRGDEIIAVNTEKGQLTYQLYWDHAILLSYSGEDELVEIPGRVMDTPVVEVASYAFSGMKKDGETVAVRDILLPAGLRKIDSCAFYECGQLEEVSFPATLESIGDRAFAGCRSLEIAEISKRVKSIGAYAFAECTGLKSVQLPSGIRTVGEGAFSCCDSLEEILLAGGSSYKVENGALYAKSAKKLVAVPAMMEGSFTVPKGIKAIGRDCFSDSRLTEVILPDSLEEIGDYAFYGANDLQLPAFPNKLKKIGNYAFSAKIGELDFSRASEKQVEILIGKNLTEIGKDAFSGIAAKRFSVEEGNPAFLAWEGALFARKDIAVIAEKTRTKKSSGKAGSTEESAEPVNVGELLTEGKVFLAALATDGFKVIAIPEGVKEFDLALLDQLELNDRSKDREPYQIYLPGSVSEFIGTVKCKESMVFHCAEGSLAEEYAKSAGIAVSHEMDRVWRECLIKTEKGELTYRINAKSAILVHYEGEDEELTIPDLIAGASVKVIGNGQGSILGNLKKKTLRRMQVPDTVEVFAAHAFENFGDFEVNMPKNLKELGDYALYGCRMQIPALPANLESIGTRAFSGTLDDMLFSKDGSTLLAAKKPEADGRLTIPEGTKRIGAYAFFGLELTEIEIPESVTEIGPYAFAYCTSLKKVTFSEGLVGIDHHAFAYAGIEAVSLPKSCEKIASSAFFGAAELKNVSGSAKEIAPYAFAYCGKLEEVKWEEGLLEIGDHAFYDTQVSQVRLPDSLEKLGAYCFATDDPKARSAVMHEFYVGENLREIGENAFACLPISDFAVHEKNACFTVTERMLTDLAGKRLVACPAGISGTVTVPDGVYEIGSFAFYRADNVTDIYIADSVGMIGQQAFYDHLGSPEGWKMERAKLHFLSGTAAQEFALEHDWPYALTDKDEDGMM